MIEQRKRWLKKLEETLTQEQVAAICMLIITADIVPYVISDSSGTTSSINPSTEATLKRLCDDFWSLRRRIEPKSETIN